MRFRCRLDPFAVFADQILQPIHRFGSGILNFTAVFADVEIHLARRTADVAKIGVRHLARPVTMHPMIAIFTPLNARSCFDLRRGRLQLNNVARMNDTHVVRLEIREPAACKML